MKKKTKIVNLAAIPLILVVCIMNASSYWTGLSLLEQEQAQMEKDLLQGRQQLLDQYLKLAQSAIAKTYAAEDTPANREAVKAILRDLRYAAYPHSCSNPRRSAHRSCHRHRRNGHCPTGSQRPAAEKTAPQE